MAPTRSEQRQWGRDFIEANLAGTVRSGEADRLERIAKGQLEMDDFSDSSWYWKGQIEAIADWREARAEHD